jgi:hypothetical protein
LVRAEFTKAAPTRADVFLGMARHARRELESAATK